MKILGLFQDLITSTAFVTAIPDSKDVPLASMPSGKVKEIGEFESFGESGVASVAGGIMLLVFDLLKDVCFCCGKL